MKIFFELKKHLIRCIKEEDGFLPLLGALAGLAGGAATLAGAAPAIGAGLGAVGAGLGGLGAATASTPKQQQGINTLQRTSRSPQIENLTQKMDTVKSAMYAMKDPSIGQDVREQYSEPLIGAYLKLKIDLDELNKKYSGGA